MGGSWITLLSTKVPLELCQDGKKESYPLQIYYREFVVKTLSEVKEHESNFTLLKVHTRVELMSKLIPFSWNNSKWYILNLSSSIILIENNYLNKIYDYSYLSKIQIFTNSLN